MMHCKLSLEQVLCCQTETAETTGQLVIVRFQHTWSLVLPGRLSVLAVGQTTFTAKYAHRTVRARREASCCALTVCLIRTAASGDGQVDKVGQSGP